ncbi:hypothetical protein GSI_08524 [Ganoderma sinense ZZ0214-1]|uniref:Uncharacterized protein n=1 Tax=Ganoderma sinense ZZ0214-1 TaxID=1077348 RepID=A0A2G8S3Y4_9APHY|nr:hypothetical protein GSI_08524 [Ganoderma sinense ZZ0214-1]
MPKAAHDGGTVRAARIEDIFYHKRIEGGLDIVEPFVVVKEYVALRPEHRWHDPFARFPNLETKIYYNRFQSNARVIRLSDVVSHFAAFTCTPEAIGVECVVARSLDRLYEL